MKRIACYDRGTFIDTLRQYNLFQELRAEGFPITPQHTYVFSYKQDIEVEFVNLKLEQIAQAFQTKDNTMATWKQLSEAEAMPLVDNYLGSGNSDGNFSAITIENWLERKDLLPANTLSIQDSIHKALVVLNTNGALLKIDKNNIRYPTCMFRKNY